MAVTFSGKKQDPLPVKKEENAANLLANIQKSVCLKFSNGYEFKISVEKNKMIISANLNGQESFYLDEIPEEFINSLRRILE